VSANGEAKLRAERSTNGELRTMVRATGASLD
jgi:hypothetical protein